ncbi:hypothetical protein CPB84DRAFT_1766844 [Gymnopilus junonius]|uniref:Uncharacterized protein n=1 Tax=Gymnopilus junonius TaxID=109634 RepID=A0A9P5TR14_GYMJU|nr:hypothetical protein CPB84DRAFT_1766844 [Gymnopilus junonius]
MKVFDPRYIEIHFRSPNSISQSMGCATPSPWPLKAETLTAQNRLEAPLKDDEERPEEYYEDGDKSCYFEEQYYQYMRCYYEAEVASYVLLKSFQGSILPTFFDAGKLIPPPNTRSIQLSVVLKEYIPNIKFSEFLLSNPIGTLQPSICMPVVDAVSQFRALEPGFDLFGYQS